MSEDTLSINPHHVLEDFSGTLSNCVQAAALRDVVPELERVA